MIISSFERKVGLKDICEFFATSPHGLKEYRKGEFSAAFSKVEGRVVFDVIMYFKILGVEI